LPPLGNWLPTLLQNAQRTRRAQPRRHIRSIKTSRVTQGIRAAHGLLRRALIRVKVPLYLPLICRPPHLNRKPSRCHQELHRTDHAVRRTAPTRIVQNASSDARRKLLPPNPHHPARIDHHRQAPNVLLRRLLLTLSAQHLAYGREVYTAVTLTSTPLPPISHSRATLTVVTVLRT